jgi:hypothetical protein
LQNRSVTRPAVQALQHTTLTEVGSARIITAQLGVPSPDHRDPQWSFRTICRNLAAMRSRAAAPPSFADGEDAWFPLFRAHRRDEKIVENCAVDNAIPIRASQRVRLVPATLRRILVARDGGCVFPGCDRPPAYTQAHHVTPWSEGGPTTLDNCVLLCSFHHHRVHDDGWTLEFDGTTVTVYRPDGTRLVVTGDTEPTEPARPEDRRRETAPRSHLASPAP